MSKLSQEYENSFSTQTKFNANHHFVQPFQHFTPIHQLFHSQITHPKWTRRWGNPWAAPRRNTWATSGYQCPAPSAPLASASVSASTASRTSARRPACRPQPCTRECAARADSPARIARLWAIEEEWIGG